MNVLKKRKGVTLTEVIISLILITMIVVGVLGYFSDGFRNIFALREQNRINFDIQEQFEQRMAEIRKEGGNGTDVQRFEYRIGNGTTNGIDVVGTTLSYDDSIKKMRLFVANKKESVLNIPDDLKVDVPRAKRYYYVGEKTPVGMLTLNDVPPSSVKIYTEPGWFLSHRAIKEKGMQIVPVGTLANSKGSTVSQVVFPKMLEDFEQLSSTTNSITITEQMRGKYLTFAGRAINSFGRVGSYQEIEQRMWIMGIPVVTGLRIHTDADLVTLKDGSAIPTTGNPETATVVRNYRTNGLFQGVIPVLNAYENKINQARQLIALGNRALQFSHNDVTKGVTTSVLVGNRSQVGPLLTYRLTNNLIWSLSLTAEGKMVVELVDTTNLNGSQTFSPGETLTYLNDNSLQVRSSVVNNSLKMEVFLNGGRVYAADIALSGTAAVSSTRVNHNVGNAAVIIGGNTYINEFAIFNRALTDSEISQMATYFSNKYVAN